MSRFLNKLVLFSAIGLLLVNCQSHPQKIATPLTSIDSVKQQKILPDTPDFPAHIKPLLSYFDQHRAESTFDTDIAFDDQGFGPTDHFYNFIKAGPLFSKTQTHAVVLYDVGVKDYRPLARLTVYKKEEPDTWRLVLDDTISVGNIRFRYKDWNSDGIADLSYVEDGWENGSHGPISWNLWLVDSSGNLHPVKGFEKLNDPRIDSFTNHIFTNNIVGHTEMWMEEYKFSRNKIIKLIDIYTDGLETPYKTKYYRHGKFIKNGKRNSNIYLEKYDASDQY